MQTTSQRDEAARDGAREGETDGVSESKMES